MSPDEKKLLERIAVLTEENNSILRGIRSHNRVGVVVKVVYWTVIIGLSYGAYVYIQPYVEDMMRVYQEASKVYQDASGIIDKFSKPLK